MPNIDLARNVITRVNQKFRDGCANQHNGPFDFAMTDRNARLGGAQRQAMRDNVAHKQVFGIKVTDENDQTVQIVETLIPTRAWATGQWLDDNPTATVGNCGERSFYAAYLLREDGVPNVTVLNGDPATSINHDFVVIGATNISQSANYSETIPPVWQGNDIVICDPWYQGGGALDYTCGIAYPLAHWPQWMPNIIKKTIAGRPTENTLNRGQFTLAIMG